MLNTDGKINNKIPKITYNQAVIIRDKKKTIYQTIMDYSRNLLILATAVILSKHFDLASAQFPPTTTPWPGPVPTTSTQSPPPTPPPTTPPPTAFTTTPPPVFVTTPPPISPPTTVFTTIFTTLSTSSNPSPTPVPGTVSTVTPPTTQSTAATTTTPPIVDCQDPEYLVWYYIVDRRFASTTSDDTELTGINTLWACQAQCRSADHKDACRSVTFLAILRKCIIHKYRWGDAGHEDTNSDSSAVVMQWACIQYDPSASHPPSDETFCPATENRFMIRVYPGQLMRTTSATSAVTLSEGQTEVNCQERCTQNDCYSVSYRQNNRRCIINTREGTTTDRNVDDRFNAFEKKCFSQSLFCPDGETRTWENTNQRTLDVTELAVYSDVLNLARCRELCGVVHAKEPCLSISYRKNQKECFIFGARRSDQVQLVTDTSHQYSEWKCSGSSAVTPAPSTLAPTPAPVTFSTTTPPTPSTPSPATVPTTSSTPVPSTTPATTTTSTTTTTATTTTIPPPADCQASESVLWYYIINTKFTSTMGDVELTGISSLWSCQTACFSADHKNACRSVTFLPTQKRCVIHNYRWRDPGHPDSTSDASTVLMQWTCINYDPNGAYPPTGQTFCSAFAGKDRLMTRVYPKHFLRTTPQSSSVTLGDDATAVRCQEECTENNCHSVGYNRFNRRCHINNRYSENRQSNNNFDVYEKACFSETLACPEGQMVTWSARLGQSLNMSALETYSNIADFQACQALCVTIAGRNNRCHSVSYKESTQDCLIFDATSTQISIVASSTLDYYELSCVEASPYTCNTRESIEWDYFPSDMAQGSNNGVVIQNVDTAALCQERCLTFTSYICKSVIYDAQQRECTLSPVNRGDAPLVANEVSTAHYFEWTCKLDSCADGETKIFFETKGKYLDGKDDAVIENVQTLYECQMMCLNHQQFTCRSTEYSDRSLTCRLSRWTEVDSKTGQLTSSTNSESFYKWQCRPVSEEAAFNMSEKCSLDAPSLFYWRVFEESRHTSPILDQAITNQTECESQCLMRSDCVAYQYRASPMRCQLLNKTDEQAGGLQPSTLFDFVTGYCAYALYNPCDSDNQLYWETFLDNRFEQPTDNVTKSGVTSLLACEAFCLKESQTVTDNKCQSVQYDTSRDECVLFNQKAPRDGLVRATGDQGYFEWKCRLRDLPSCGAGEQIQAVEKSGRIFDSDQFSVTFERVGTSQQCGEMCRDFTAFTCMSFDHGFTSRRCILHARQASDPDTTLTENADFSYYTMSCGSVGASTSKAPTLSSPFTLVLALLLCCLGMLVFPSITQEKFIRQSSS